MEGYLKTRAYGIQVTSIGGAEDDLSLHSTMSFTNYTVKSLDTGRFSGLRWKVQAIVPPKVRTKLHHSFSKIQRSNFINK